MQFHSRSNGCRLARWSEFGSRPSASEIALKETAYFPPGDCHDSSLISLRFTLCIRTTRTGIGSFFAVEVIGLCSFHDYFFVPLLPHCEFATVRIKTGIAARIIGDDIVNEILLTHVGELVCVARPKE